MSIPLSQRAINARRRQERLSYEAPKMPEPPKRGVSAADRDAAYRALDEALQTANGFRVIRHPQRHHLIDSMIIGLGEGGVETVLLLAEKLKASSFLRGKKWLKPNRLLTDIQLQTDLLANVYD